MDLCDSPDAVLENRGPNLSAFANGDDGGEKEGGGGGMASALAAGAFRIGVEIPALLKENEDSLSKMAKNPPGSREGFVTARFDVLIFFVGDWEENFHAVWQN